MRNVTPKCISFNQFWIDGEIAYNAVQCRIIEQNQEEHWRRFEVHCTGLEGGGGGWRGRTNARHHISYIHLKSPWINHCLNFRAFLVFEIGWFVEKQPDEYDWNNKSFTFICFYFFMSWVNAVWWSVEDILKWRPHFSSKATSQSRIPAQVRNAHIRYFGEKWLIFYLNEDRASW